MQSFNREDYIHRLEQDNERLKQIILGNEMEITAKDETIDQLQKVIKDLEWQIKQILEDNESYQKENAELQEKCKMLEQGYVWHDYDAGEDCYEDTHEGKWVKREEVYQLAKAKEIIRDLLFHLGNTFIVSYTSKEESITKAEQFLKEYEKE